MQLAILFWCYKEPEVCANKLRLLRHYNPSTPIYVLFGGEPAEAHRFETEFLPYADDFYTFPEDKSSHWKWWHGDMLISRWFTERGHQLKWDSIFIAQWDMLVFGPVEKLFIHLRDNELLLSGEWALKDRKDVDLNQPPSPEKPMREIEWVRRVFLRMGSNYQEFRGFLREYNLQEQDAWWCVFLVIVLPRAFMERFSVRKSPELGFLEYTIPTLAKAWGFDICRNHPYNPWQVAHPYDHVLNAEKKECPDRYVLLHLLDPRGGRIFHPYTRELHADRLSPVVPEWVNFLRCREWDCADLLGDSTRAILRHAIAGYDLALPHPVTTRPAICLNMIARNEAHLIREVLDSVAPYISSWVIVDTGSDDGTQDVIRNHMASLGIPGELYERPWRDLAHNRSEALALAQGGGDYIWIVDADDTVVGTPDFTRLGAGIYWLRYGEGADVYWRPRLLRDGMCPRFRGALHEYPASDDESCVVGVRLDGEYHIESRRGDARHVDPRQMLECDRDLLLADVERNPEDAQSVFHLAQTCFNLGDFVNARKWYARRAEMAGSEEEEIYAAMYRTAMSMSELGEPYPDVQDAYLRAWDFRPTRAEPLYAIARRYRVNQQYRLGYLFAQLAAEISLPEQDTSCVDADVYSWRAADEQAVCASWIDKHAEALTLWRGLLARPDLPDEDRQRIAANCDMCVPAVGDGV